MRRAVRGYLIAVRILNGLAGLICGVLFIVSPDGLLDAAAEQARMRGCTERDGMRNLVYEL